MPPQSREIAFPDRYSICALSANKVKYLEMEEIQKLCHDLYNDIYLMDQAACSSPQLIAWVGDVDDVALAKAKIWPQLAEYAHTKYDLMPIHVMEKFVHACNTAINSCSVQEIIHGESILYRHQMENLRGFPFGLRAFAGVLYEITLSSLDDIKPIVMEGLQTFLYLGFSRKELHDFVVFNQLKGIDRMVPVGQAIDMEVIWDGYDVISSLSRIVDIK